MFKVKRCFDLSENEKNIIEQSDLAAVREKSYFTSALTEKFEILYNNNTFDNHTLFVFNNNIPMMTFPLYLKNGECSFFGRPLDFIFSENINSSNMLASIYQVREFLQSNKSIYQKILFYNHPLTNKVFGLSLEIPHVFESHGSIDLTLSEEMIRKGIRQSYRSLINWGKTKLRTEIIDFSNCTPEKFDEFRNFHLQVSGRETRTIETWHTQLEIISSKLGFLVYAYYEEKLVSAVMVLGGTETCLYSVGVNDRELMKQNVPIGHYPIFLAVLHAKSLGLTKFLFSIVASSEFNDKENAIAKFKKGFASSIEDRIRYQISL